MKNWMQLFTLIVCLVLLITVVVQRQQMNVYQQNMDDRLDMLQSQISAEISSVSDRVEAALEEQNRLVKDFSLEPAGLDAEKKALSSRVCVSLKEWSPDTAVTLAASIGGESLSVAMVPDIQGSYTAQLLLPLEEDRELFLDVQIQSEGRIRQEELGAWGDIAMLLPLQNSGGGWSGPAYQDGTMESQFNIFIEGRDGQPVSVHNPQFLIYKNGVLTQTLDAVNDPFSDNAQGYSFTVDTQDNYWRLECAEGDVIHIRFRCCDEFGLGYDFLFMTWVAAQDNVYAGDGAGFQSGSCELELFWD